MGKSSHEVTPTFALPGEVQKKCMIIVAFNGLHSKG